MTVQKSDFSDLIDRTKSNLPVNFSRYYGKTNFEVYKYFNTNTALVAHFEILFTSSFFEVKKRRQDTDVATTA